MTVKELIQLTKDLFEQREKLPEEKETERLALRNRIVELNLRLVPHMLKKYQPYTEDTYQTACIGLIQAVDSYSTTRSVPFPNYACVCIENAIRMQWKLGKGDCLGADHRTKIRSLQEFMDYSEGEVTLADFIADPRAELDFNEIFEQTGLDILFDRCILPAIDAMASRSSTLDMDKWKDLEIRYLLELSQEKSQQRRITFTRMAKELDTSTQNIRTRHSRVMDRIIDNCRAYGYAPH